MPSVVFSRNLRFIREIARAVGLDPDANHITAITLETDVRDVARVTVRMIVDTDQDGALSEVLRHYSLEEKTDASRAALPTV